MYVHDVFDDGKPQARAFGLVAGLIDAVEAFGDARQVGGGDTDAVVLNMDVEGVAGDVGIQSDRLA